MSEREPNERRGHGSLPLSASGRRGSRVLAAQRTAAGAGPREPPARPSTQPRYKRKGLPPEAQTIRKETLEVR